MTFDDATTNTDKIEMAVATVGHDTPHHKAKDKVYDRLPGFCKYDRTPEKEKANESEHSGRKH